MNLQQQRQAAYDANNKSEVARLNVEILKTTSRKELTIDEIFARAAKRKSAK